MTKYQGNEPCIHCGRYLSDATGLCDRCFDLSDQYCEYCYSALPASRANCAFTVLTISYDSEMGPMALIWPGLVSSICANCGHQLDVGMTVYIAPTTKGAQEQAGQQVSDSPQWQGR